VKIRFASFIDDSTLIYLVDVSADVQPGSYPVSVKVRGEEVTLERGLVVVEDDEDFDTGPSEQATGSVDWKAPARAGLDAGLELLRTTLKAQGVSDAQVTAAVEAQVAAFFAPFTEAVNTMTLNFPAEGGAVNGEYDLSLVVAGPCRFELFAFGILSGGYNAETGKMSGVARLNTVVTLNGGVQPNGDPCPEPPVFEAETPWSATREPSGKISGTIERAVDVPPELATYAGLNSFDLPFTLAGADEDDDEEDDARPIIRDVTTDPESVSVGDSYTLTIKGANFHEEVGIFFVKAGVYVGARTLTVVDSSTIEITLFAYETESDGSFVEAWRGQVEIRVVNDLDGRNGWNPSEGPYNERVSERSGFYEIR
jgi:hypothetical protein